MTGAFSKVILAFAVLILVLAVIAGFSTGPGQDIANAAGSIAMTTLRWTGASIGRLAAWWGTAGNAPRAFIAGAALFLLTLIAPPVRGSQWALLAMALVAVAFGVLLYNPSLAAGVGT